MRDAGLGGILMAGRPYWERGGDSERNAGTGAQEAHELRRPAAEAEEPREEPARGGLGLAQAGDGDEVLALEVLDQRVLAVEARRRALERLAAEAEALPERRVLHDRLPATRARGDRRPDGVQRLAVRLPAAAGHEDMARLEVQIDAGAVDVPAPLVAELMPVCVLYGDLSRENRMSRWMRNSDLPLVRGSAK